LPDDLFLSYPVAGVKMPPSSLEQTIPELRDAIGPVILISGVGLLLFTECGRKAIFLSFELPQ